MSAEVVGANLLPYFMLQLTACQFLYDDLNVLFFNSANSVILT